METKRSRSWRPYLFLFTAFMALYTGLGWYLSQIKNYMPYDALSRLVSAWLVWRGAETKLATIGFVWPPIPTAALLPLAWFHPLVKSWMALVLVSAFFMAISVLLISRILRVCGVTGFWRYLLVILFGINPINLVFAINGMSEAILVTVCLASFLAFLDFWDSDRNLPMMIAAFFFSLLPLIRYEFAIVSLAAGLALLIHSWTRRSGKTLEQFNAFLEGRLLAFSSLAIYPIFLWCILSWLIMGSPFYFLVNDRSAINLASEQLTGPTLLFNHWKAFSTVFEAWFLAFPIALLATLALIYYSWRTRSIKYATFAFFPLLIPLFEYLLLSNGANVPLMRYFMTNVMFGFLLIAILVGAMRKLHRLDDRQYHWLGAATVVLVVASTFFTHWVLMRFPYSDIETIIWRGLVSGNLTQNADFSDAYQVGHELPVLIPPGSRVLIDTYQFGFGIILGADRPEMFMDFTDPNYDQAVLKPSQYVDYLIVPTTEGRGALYSINRFHPSLYENGAAWATPIKALNDSGATQWRLYKVTREPQASVK